MSRVISVRDIQEMIRNGQGVSIPDDALVTPSARDFLNDLQANGGASAASNGNGNGNKSNGAKNGNGPFAAGENPKSEIRNPNRNLPRLQESVWSY